MFVRKFYRDRTMRERVVGGVHHPHTAASRLFDDFVLTDSRWSLVEHGSADHRFICRKSYSKARQVHIECVAPHILEGPELGETSCILHIRVSSELL